MVHLGVIQGQGLLPWLVLCILVLAERLRGPAPDERLGRRASSAAAGRSSALVRAGGLVVLTGEPRAIADIASSAPSAASMRSRAATVPGSAGRRARRARRRCRLRWLGRSL